MNTLFKSHADEIFKSANITKKQAPEMYQECIEILSAKMAHLSATMGLSYERAEIYDRQKSTLIEDLKKLAAERTLR